MAEGNGNGGNGGGGPSGPPPGITKAEYKALRKHVKAISDILDDVAMRYGWDGYDE
jgi:hypothetical protein